MHANSVKLSTPDFRHTETPWLNLEVRLLSGPFAGLKGFVKDVEVTPVRSLAITVHFSHGHKDTVGYHAVREAV